MSEENAMNDSNDDDLAEAGEETFEQECDRACVEQNMPRAVEKALHDPFDYALMLKNGTLIRFQEASMVRDTDWVRLSWEDDGVFGVQKESRRPIPFPCPRGIDVRISEILWVADAPGGS